MILKWLFVVTYSFSLNLGCGTTSWSLAIPKAKKRWLNLHSNLGAALQALPLCIWKQSKRIRRPSSSEIIKFHWLILEQNACSGFWAIPAPPASLQGRSEARGILLDTRRKSSEYGLAQMVIDLLLLAHSDKYPFHHPRFFLRFLEGTFLRSQPHSSPRPPTTWSSTWPRPNIRPYRTINTFLELYFYISKKDRYPSITELSDLNQKEAAHSLVCGSITTFRFASLHDITTHFTRRATKILRNSRPPPKQQSGFLYPSSLCAPIRNSKAFDTVLEIIRWPILAVYPQGYQVYQLNRVGRTREAVNTKSPTPPQQSTSAVSVYNLHIRCRIICSIHLIQNRIHSPLLKFPFRVLGVVASFLERPVCWWPSWRLNNKKGSHLSKRPCPFHHQTRWLWI